MRTFLKRYFSAVPEQSTTVEDIKPSELEVPRYPPTDRGLPLVSIEDVLASQSELITRIQRTAGLKPEDYASLIQPVIHNFARYVHLLPATNTLNHRGAGGLFRMGLELGLYSLQVANSTSFTSKGSTSSEARFRNHPKWVFATFIAAICGEIYRPISNMVVVDDEGKKWSQLLSPLYDWLSENNKKRYYIIWNAQEGDEIGFQQANSAYLLTSIVPQSSLQYLNDGDNDIMLAMTSCVTGAQGSNTQISKIVDSIRHKVVQKDLKTNSESFGMQIVGAHLEPHLLDAMRRLMKDGTWTVNIKGARIWYSKNDGLFVVWFAAAREILKLVEKDGRQGIPQDADTLADILIACGAADSTDEGERYWSIQIPGSMQLLGAIKISDPEILLQNSDIPPLDARLLIGSMPATNQKEPVKSIVKDMVDFESGEITTSPKSIEVAVPIDALLQREDANVESPPAAVLVVAPSPAPAPAALAVGVTQSKNPIVLPPDVTSNTQVKNIQVDAVKKPVVQKMGMRSPDKKPTTKPIGMFTPKAAGGVKEKIVPLGSRAAELFGALKQDVRDYLQAILDDFENKRTRGPVFCVPQGMAISTEQLNSHGQVNYTGLLQALSNKHWLWEDTENFPNGKKLHDLEHEGAMVKVMIIKSDIAREIGFNWKGVAQ